MQEERNDGSWTRTKKKAWKLKFEDGELELEIGGVEIEIGDDGLEVEWDD